MRSESPRVLHVVWNLIRGGTEGQCARVAMELARRGGVQHVAAFRREGFFLPAVEQTCGPVREVGIPGLFKPGVFSAIGRWAEGIRAARYDLLHTWDADAAIFGQYAAARAGIPLITSRRDLGQIYPWYKRALLQRADVRAAAVVANARAIADHFAKRGIARDKFRVIPNILDLPEFDALSGRALPFPVNWNPDQTVVMVARLDPEKDHATFLRAAARVLARRPGAEFVLAGDGVERPRLERLAGELGLTARVHFLGEVTDVPALLRHAAVGALTPSRNEGLSNTILEYMAARLPVVATDCGGNCELVDSPRGGVIVRPGDDAALADAILALLHDPDRRRASGEHNRARVEADHRPAKVADQFMAMYASVGKGSVLYS